MHARMDHATMHLKTLQAMQTYGQATALDDDLDSGCGLCGSTHDKRAALPAGRNHRPRPDL